MQLNLSDTETVLLRELLADYLPALRREVARTEQHDLRHHLVQRPDLVEWLLEQLGEQTAYGAGYRLAVAGLIDAGTGVHPDQRLHDGELS
jgi:hypothetical protein